MRARKLVCIMHLLLLHSKIEQRAAKRYPAAGGYDEIKSVRSSGPSGPYRRGVNILQIRNVPARL